MKKVKIYTDGACSGNPGPGGWCAILLYMGVEKVISGGKPITTNNNMELTAVYEGLKALKEPCEVEVVSDSQYVTNAFNKKWVYNWEKDNFANRPNSEIWIELLKLTRIHKVTFTWVRGHNGDTYNERCDAMAVLESSKYNRL